MKKALLLVNIGQLLTLRCNHAGPRRGPDMSELGIMEDAAVLCIEGKIVSVGSTKDALRDAWVKKNRKNIIEFDCENQVVTPGFVDSHTHPAFLTPRLVDFEKRISGATYEKIAEAGGGIRSSIDGVRRASRALLAHRVLDGLQQMAQQGTTTVEAKSGYGLSLESELKSLQAIRDAAACWPGTVVSTLLGAHVVPTEFRGRAEEYVELVCEKMIPVVAKRKLAQFVDVFVERGAFTAGQAETIFAAAQKHGLATRAHVCQLSPTAVEPLLRFRPASFDHMDWVDERELPRLASADTVATLVPGANYFLGLDRYPPARKLIDAGVAVALATDYNPGSSPTPSMPFVLSLACTHMKMSPEEAITAGTFNGACSLRVQEKKGSIEPGKDADLSVFEAADYREIAYWFASDHCAATVLQGAVMISGASAWLG